MAESARDVPGQLTFAFMQEPDNMITAESVLTSRRSASADLTSSWSSHDIRLAKLIEQSVSPGAEVNSEQVYQVVTATFPRAVVSPSGIRGALAYMTRNGRARIAGRGISSRNRPCSLYRITA